MAHLSNFHKKYVFNLNRVLNIPDIEKKVLFLKVNLYILFIVRAKNLKTDKIKLQYISKGFNQSTIYFVIDL